MNPVEIEEAVSDLASAQFDADGFPYAFLTAFGNKETAIKRLRSGQSNSSDVPRGVLQRNNIHMAVCDEGAVDATLNALRQSPKTVAGKAKLILATDGTVLAAEDLLSGEVISAPYPKFAEHFGFFLPLAGISTVKEIKNNPIDVKATGRLNKLYVELLRDNPDWGTEKQRPALNQFMARLIFCFFAEDTGIFRDNQFTRTIDQMSDSQSGNTHEVLAELFRAMDTRPEDRAKANLRSWADTFPYVNGGLFTGSTGCPKFSRIARSYLLRAGELNWQEINPDIFGSMIQAVADDDERGELGLHYTSVPNILKVLNPLFLDDLRAHLELADNNLRKLRNLRKRLGSIRVFDPACGSGNFLVIAYKEMRAIENEVIKRTKDEPRSVIPLANFYGIEIKSFAAEIARLALLIAEFQADCAYISQQEARAMVLPLHRTGQIVVGNSLERNWLEVCPPISGASVLEHDLAGPTGRLALDEIGAGEPETYICGNPPYLGGKKQSAKHKADMAAVFGKTSQYKNLDYICAFFLLAAKCLIGKGKVAFVSTSSINQGTHVPTFWPMLFERGVEIAFAYEPFKWANNAQNNAGVYVTIVGLSKAAVTTKYIYGESSKKIVTNINAYLIEGASKIVNPLSAPLSPLSPMITGNAAYDGGHLFFEPSERDAIVQAHPQTARWFAKVSGTSEFTDGKLRWCLWLENGERQLAERVPILKKRLDAVLSYREDGGEVASTLVHKPHQFRYRHRPRVASLLVPQVSAENREYIPIGLLEREVIITHLAHVIYDPAPHDLSLLSSRLHMVWTRTLAGRLGNGIRYASNLCWNTFPIVTLTDRNRADLADCAANILLARESYFPTTVAELYNPISMPGDLRRAHDENDEVLERIYIGRRFRNDTERLEKLFDLHLKLVATQPQTKKKKAKSAA